MTSDSASKEEELSLFHLVLNRYGKLIDEKESHPISELRQRVSPEDPYIQMISHRMTSEIPDYDSSRDFLLAAERAILHISKIKTIHLHFSFYQTFEEMETTGIASSVDKAMLLTALLRSFGSRDSRIIITKKDKVLVRFDWKDATRYVIAESGSTIIGDEIWKLLSEDSPAYSFSDLEYENYEDD